MAIKNIYYRGNSYKISYEIVNKDKEDYILILHGWGANKELMLKAFKKAFINLKQIYVDIPGFGNSSIVLPLTTKDYANIINIFIEKMQKLPFVIMGHSFGGKIATLLNPKRLVLLSSAGIVEKKPLSVKIKIFIFKCLKIFGFGKLYYLFASKDVAGMNSVMYATFKNVVNEDFSKVFSNFSGESLIFWGKNDKATTIESGYKIRDLIKCKDFFSLNGDHFFFLLHSDFIAKKIEEKWGMVSVSNEVFQDLSLNLDKILEIDSNSKNKSNLANLDLKEYKFHPVVNGCHLFLSKVVDITRKDQKKPQHTSVEEDKEGNFINMSLKYKNSMDIEKNLTNQIKSTDKTDENVINVANNKFDTNSNTNLDNKTLSIDKDEIAKLLIDKKSEYKELFKPVKVEHEDENKDANIPKFSDIYRQRILKIYNKMKEKR